MFDNADLQKKEWFPETTAQSEASHLMTAAVSLMLTLLGGPTPENRAIVMQIVSGFVEYQGHLHDASEEINLEAEADDRPDC